MGEPQAFEVLRLFGQKYLEQNSWPTRKHENWHYNKLDVFKNTLFIDADEEVNAPQIKISPAPNWYRIVFINGIYSADQSQLPIEQQVRVLTLADAIQKGLYPIFDLSQPKHTFEAHNLAQLREGVFIDIAANTTVEKPVEIYFYNTLSDSATAFFPRIIVQAQANSKATILESYESQTKTHNTSEPVETKSANATLWTNAQVEVHLLKNSSLEWARIQNQSPSHLHTCRSYYKVYDSAKLHFLTQAQGAQFHKHELNVEILGENCEVVTHGISIGNNNDQKDNQTLIDFKKGKSQVEQIYKSILNDSAQSVFNGKIIIQKDAQKADATQLNQNLLLSDTAEANTQPQLEIYADDVKASHGATIGQLNPEEIFYFRSRGISETKAKEMLQVGFALDLIERFPHPEIKKYLRDHLNFKVSQN